MLKETIDDFNYSLYIRKMNLKYIPSQLGKRKLEDAFGEGNHDEERYGQQITEDFFKNNYGHSVVNKK